MMLVCLVLAWCSAAVSGSADASWPGRRATTIDLSISHNTQVLPLLHCLNHCSIYFFICLNGWILVIGEPLQSGCVKPPGGCSWPGSLATATVLMLEIFSPTFDTHQNILSAPRSQAMGSATLYATCSNVRACPQVRPGQKEMAASKVSLIFLAREACRYPEGSAGKMRRTMAGGVSNGRPQVYLAQMASRCFSFQIQSPEQL